jgi:tyrosine-protein phosphatase SIW14
MGIYGRTVRIFGIAALGVSLAAAQANAESSVGTVRSVSSDAVQPDIFNFGQVDPGYYRGGELKGQDAADLAKLGVKTVIDLRNDGDYDPAESEAVRAAGMTYVRIPMTTRTAPTSDQIEQFMSLVSNHADSPVYVHCVEGRHRTGVMTAVYRMASDGWTAEQAFSEMKKYKFGMDFLHPEFKKFVYGYQAAPATQLAATKAAAPSTPSGVVATVTAPISTPAVVAAN